NPPGGIIFCAAASNSRRLITSIFRISPGVWSGEVDCFEGSFERETIAEACFVAVWARSGLAAATVAAVAVTVRNSRRLRSMSPPGSRLRMASAYARQPMIHKQRLLDSSTVFLASYNTGATEPFVLQSHNELPK